MKKDEIFQVIKIPICIINKLRDEYKGNKDDLIEVQLVNYNQSEYNSVALLIDGYENKSSQYGYYYTKRKELDKYLETGEFENMENKKFNYYYRVEYTERNLVKIIPSNKKYNLGDYIIVTSESSKYCIGFINEVMLSKEDAENKYPSNRIIDRRIVCKIEDSYGKLEKELNDVKLEIKSINSMVANKYLLLLLNNESTPELDEIKHKLKTLLDKEKALSKELEKYE